VSSAPGREREIQIALDTTRFSSILSVLQPLHFAVNTSKHIAQASPAGTLAGAQFLFAFASIHIIPATMSPVLPLIIIS
jgi:hypothetical protein